MKTVALYCRISKAEESIENQLVPLRKFTESLEAKIVGEYLDTVSGGTSDRPQFKKLMQDAARHKFDLVLIWSLDRFSREGILQTLSYIKRLKSNNVALKSLQESWLDTSDEGMGELLISIFSWVGQQERKRISERTKTALERKKARGQTLGRPKGAKDKKPRSRKGYFK